MCMIWTYVDHTNKKKLNKFLNISKNPDISTNKNKYMVQHFKRFRIEHPTTCAYQFITEDINSKD